LYEAGEFGVFSPFLVNNLKPICNNEGEGKEEPFLFLLLGEGINHHIFFSLLVNDLIIISKQLGHPFLLLRG
jgi:hypothetical protein